jgi:hypothetical protein
MNDLVNGNLKQLNSGFQALHILANCKSNTKSDNMLLDDIAGRRNDHKTFLMREPAESQHGRFDTYPNKESEQYIMPIGHPVPIQKAKKIIKKKKYY